jgi:hypothetical protein
LIRVSWKVTEMARLSKKEKMGERIWKIIKISEKFTQFTPKYELKNLVELPTEIH